MTKPKRPRDTNQLAKFIVDLATGEALDPPAEYPLAAYDVVIEDGRVLIEVPDGPLLVNE